MTLADVAAGQPHVAAHNNERHAINDLTDKVNALQNDKGHWTASTHYVPHDFVWAFGARAECIMDNSDAVFDATKWKFYGSPRQFVEFGDTTARKAFTTPGAVPILTGTFTAISTTVYVDARLQATISGLANCGATLFVNPVSDARSPRPFYQGEVRANAKDILIGMAAPSPKNIIVTGHTLGSAPTTISKMTKISGLTIGQKYNFELCLFVIGEFDYEGPNTVAATSLPGATEVAVARSVEQSYPPGTLDAAISHAERGSYVACVVCTDGIRLVRFPGLGMAFAPYVWKTIFTAALGGAAPLAVDVTPDGSKFVVVGVNGATSKISVINVKDGTFFLAPATIAFPPRSVQCQTNNIAFVVLDLTATTPGLFLLGYNLTTGAATGVGTQIITTAAPATVPACHRIPLWNPAFQVVCVGTKAFVYNVASQPVLIYTITHFETIQVCEVGALSDRIWVAGASGKVSEYPLTNTATPTWTFQVVDTTGRINARARNWIRMQRFPGTIDTHLGLFSSSAGTPGSYGTTGFNFYEIDVSNYAAGPQQYTQWPSVGSDGIGGAPFGGGYITEDGTIIGMIPSKNTFNDWYGSLVSVDPTWFLTNDHSEVSFSPAVS